MIKAAVSDMTPHALRTVVNDEFGWKGVEKQENAFSPKSPEDVWDEAHNLNMNGTQYDPVNNNCQNWVKQLCDKLGYTVKAEDLGEKGGWGQIIALASADVLQKTAALK